MSIHIHGTETRLHPLRSVLPLRCLLSIDRSGWNYGRTSTTKPRCTPWHNGRAIGHYHGHGLRTPGHCGRRGRHLEIKETNNRCMNNNQKSGSFVPWWGDSMCNQNHVLGRRSEEFWTSLLVWILSVLPLAYLYRVSVSVLGLRIIWEALRH